jgi:hypothetical protein
MSCSTTTTTIVAGSTLWVTATFTDKDGAAMTPASVAYEIVCLTTDTTINDSGTATPGTTSEIEVTDTENALITATNSQEKRRMIVTATDSNGDKAVATHDWYVRAQS